MPRLNYTFLIFWSSYIALLGTIAVVMVAG
jgi:hypothetical protein